MTATYDRDLIDRLIADIRAEVARTPYAAHRAVVADQLEAARREVELMRPIVRAAEQIRNADSVGRQLIGSVDRAIDAYRAAQAKP